MLLLSNIIIIIILSSCIYFGLDKLIPTIIFFGIILLSDIFNASLNGITAESKIISIIPRITDKNKAKKILKIICCFLFLLGWLTFLSAILSLTGGKHLSVEDSNISKLFCVCIYVLLYFYGLFAIRTVQKTYSNGYLEPNAQWYKFLQYLSIYQIIFGIFFILSDSYGFSEEIREKYLYVIFDSSILALLGYWFCVLAERFLDTIRILSSLLKNTESNYEIPFFIRILASHSSLKSSLITTTEAISGINLSKSEIAEYVSKHIEPVTISAIIIFWLISSVVIVPPEKEAIFYKLGKINGNHSYKPGLHLKLPWPFEKMELYKPNMIKTINIGFKPDPTQRHIIWTKSHASENFYLLVGDGIEILAVDCQLLYKVNDLYKYITKVNNPEDYIEALAYQLLTNKTVSQNFDQIISQNRNKLSSDLKKELQEKLNEEDIGVTIVDIMFLAIHPPIEVADVYEDVISAQSDKQTLIMKANSESIKEICMKKAFAQDEINKAKSYAETTVANAIGEAVSFESRIIGYNTDSDLEEFRLKLDSIQKMAKSKNLYVIDKSIMRKNDRIILNLQN